jgi:uncharacterized protein (TIGR03435 family)
MRTVIVLLANFLAAPAQQPQAPAFEVASIRAGQPGRESIEFGPASLTMRSVRLSGCIRWAYGVQEVQVIGPTWISDGWFDIFAKSASAVPVTELRQMLQQLLAERFKLAAHRDTKEMTSLILTVAKSGHKLEPTETEGSPSFQTGKLSATGRGATLEPLLALLSRELGEPVIDQTGLTGRFNYFVDIDPYFTEESRKAASGVAGPPPDANAIIAAAFQKELGLKVEAKKVPVEVIVVDHVEKTPTEN